MVTVLVIVVVVEIVLVVVIVVVMVVDTEMVAETVEVGVMYWVGVIMSEAMTVAVIDLDHVRLVLDWSIDLRYDDWRACGSGCQCRCGRYCGRCNCDCRSAKLDVIWQGRRSLTAVFRYNSISIERLRLPWRRGY